MRKLIFFSVALIGFFTESVVIQILTTYFNVPPFEVRFYSIPVAVFITWLINRKITFNSKNHVGWEVGKYIAVQAVGGVINLSIYYILLLHQNFYIISPIVALLTASIFSVNFTYVASQKFVFIQKFYN
jgi:putative flippase GtrA